MSAEFIQLDAGTIRAHKGKSFTGIAVTFMCHDGHGRFYMTQRGPGSRDEQGTWDIGGGGLKFREATTAGAQREAEEEYGARVLGEPQLLGFREVFRTAPDGTPTHWLTFDYLLLVEPSSMHINEPEMLSDAGWFTLDNLPSPRHSQMETLYWERYNEQLRDLLV